VLTRSRDKLAVVRTNDGTTSFIGLYRANGGPPATPQPVCDLRSASGLLDSPSWSPDGRALAYATPRGIVVAEVPDLSSAAACSRIRFRSLVTGGSDPYWGPR
jgi:Tol biopolymer transport system component